MAWWFGLGRHQPRARLAAVLLTLLTAVVATGPGAAQSPAGSPAPVEPPAQAPARSLTPADSSTLRNRNR